MQFLTTTSEGYISLFFTLALNHRRYLCSGDRC